jgi:hypothetical protein
VAGRIISIKKSSDTIGNRTLNLPVCSAVPQPLRYRVCSGKYIIKLSFDNGVMGYGVDSSGLG